MIRDESEHNGQGKTARAWAMCAIAWWLAWGASGWVVGESVTLAWDPNSEPDLAGYRLYYGTASRSYDRTIEVADGTSVPVADLDAGTTYYFAVTAYNTAGLESDFSNEVSYTTLEPTTNQPPYAVDLDLVMTADQSVSVNLVGFDPDGDPLTYSIVDGTEHGLITGIAPLLTYTPEAGFVGTDGFTYTVSDGLSQSTPAQVTLVVNPDPNLPPILTQPNIVDVKYSGYGLTLTWTSEPGSSYRILIKDSFSDLSWEPISDAILADGPRTSWLDLAGTATGGRLYRVLLVSP
jgi:hypothetical protein